MSGFDHPENRPRTLGAVTVLLTAAAGALNVFTFFSFNGVFASTMSGNLVLSGLSVGRGAWGQALEEVSAITGYVVGLALGSVQCGWLMRRRPWRSAVTVALGVELGLLTLVGTGWWLADGRVGRGGAVLLVIGCALAMGVQAAACRYIGPSGTPTNFLTGTVTNWVSAFTDPNRPRWDGNSAIRIVALAGGAVAGALLQVRAPAWVIVLPVGLVIAALALMGRVVQANHGGLTVGEAEYPEIDGNYIPRDEVPRVQEDESPDSDPTGEEAVPTRGVGHVHGRVSTGDEQARTAALTLLDLTGEQVARSETDSSGAYRIVPPKTGEYLLLCTPQVIDVDDRMRPHAVLVAVDGRPVLHDIRVGAGDTGSAEPLEAV